MAMTKGRIARAGTVHFHDTSLSIWEDGITKARNAGGYQGAKSWRRQFKHDVFARIVQQLNRLGWRVAPWIDSDKYRAIALDHRTCTKGDLQAELSLNGRHIEFQVWQDVQNVDNPNGGKHDFDKTDRMTYLQRLEMNRTRSRISDYLCNVFTDYRLTPPKIKGPNPDPLAYFNDRWDSECDKQRGAHRFSRGPDGWPSDKELASWDRKDQDGAPLNHGDVRWTRDRKGRLLRGRVYGGINGMWMLVYGPGQRDHTHDNAGRFFTYRPGETPRKLVAPHERRIRLEGELTKAIKAMHFERAAVLRDLKAKDRAAEK
ncbi:UvrB/UvrC motif-containing protein [Achromobacter kerstersii]|uniref:UvrB/UvrC motif-containing protein n=1 Tax=Achromobacter kerstersii TaxID=1353890 RepID=UPI00320AE89A